MGSPWSITTGEVREGSKGDEPKPEDLAYMTTLPRSMAGA